MKENVLYILYMIGFFLARVIPLKVGYLVAELVARGYYLFSRRDKEGLKDNLRVVLGEGTDEHTMNAYVLEVFRNFAKYLVDFFKFRKFDEKVMSRYIRIRGKENIDKCLEKGKGVILVSLHLGNWELGGTVVAGMKYPVNAIALEHSHKKINEFFTRQRGINGTRSIPLGMGIKESFRALARNEVLAIMGDKDYTSGGINIDFFGRPARMPKGPAAFSLKTGAPILVTVMVREKDDTFTLHIDPPIEKSASPGSEIRVQDLMGEYIKVFERYIREHPGQWYVFRRIWKPQ